MSSLGVHKCVLAVGVMSPVHRCMQMSRCMTWCVPSISMPLDVPACLLLASLLSCSSLWALACHFISYPALQGLRDSALELMHPLVAVHAEVRGREREEAGREGEAGDMQKDFHLLFVAGSALMNGYACNCTHRH